MSLGIPKDAEIKQLIRVNTECRKKEIEREADRLRNQIRVNIKHRYEFPITFALYLRTAQDIDAWKIVHREIIDTKPWTCYSINKVEFGSVSDPRIEITIVIDDPDELIDTDSKQSEP